MPAADLGLPGPSSWVVVGCGIGLVAGTMVRLVFWWGRPGEVRNERLRSLATWWGLYLILALAVLGGTRTIVILLGALSLVGIWEYVQLTREQVNAAWLAPTMYGLASAHFGALAVGYVEAAWIGTPMVILLVLLLAGLLFGPIEGFVRSIGTALFGSMLIAYGLSHAALVALARREVGSGDGIGRFLFLILLTELHDIAQALWGRALGRRKIVPVISPGKSWEGFLLGTITTIGLAAILAPMLTISGEAGSNDSPVRTATTLEAAVAGLVIAISGFLGDISLSAVKRDCGVKDSGRALPGQGGVLDRVDSLTLAAPAFFYYTLAISRHTG